MCPFVHPKTLCPYYPKCKFANNCLYKHPEGKVFQCRFGLYCKNLNCSYEHPSKNPLNYKYDVRHNSENGDFKNPESVKFSQENIILCKFDPNCLNKKCFYKHPIREDQDAKKLKKLSQSNINIDTNVDIEEKKNLLKIDQKKKEKSIISLTKAKAKTETEIEIEEEALAQSNQIKH